MLDTPNVFIGEVITSFRGSQKSNIKKQDLIYATLTRVDGKVRVVGLPGYVNYIPENGGEPGIAWNTVAPELDDMPVVIGVREGQTEREVLWIDKSRLQDGGQLDTPLAGHALGHMYGHTDPLWIDPRTILDLRVWPTLGTMRVNVAGGRYNAWGRGLTFAGQADLDLTAEQPPVDMKVAVGLYLSYPPQLGYVTGAVVPRPTLPIPEPAWPKQALPVALIILYGGQDYIDWEDCKNRRVLWSGPAPSILEIQVFS